MKRVYVKVNISQRFKSRVEWFQCCRVEPNAANKVSVSLYFFFFFSHSDSLLPLVWFLNVYVQ